ncbi:MAG: UDP-N-acetylmuramoyl-L-alanyl-D-glutamate--2,6-diaminopimelate ligase [Nocardioides sp.]|nr:UDP-N-acetylmuramoyl-L-alanyl-D-glutamate--2,6-diaminopimelate ligase [Nocardioides sp.]
MTAPRSPVPSGRTLEALAALLGVPAPPGAGDVRVTGVTLASQRTTPGDLYAGLPGARAHGADFAADAIGRGAVAVLTDAAGQDRLGGVDVPVLVVESPRDVLGALAAEVHDHPARALRLVAVTGTQGKTTTTRLLEGALEAVGTRAGVVGTVGTRIAGADVASALTTPEAPDLHALFAQMRDAGVDTCAMEVSSHALVMGRVDGVVFDVAVFTNLGRDHLDFHADVEEYFEAKASLFTPERSRRALVNVDDAHGRVLAQRALVPTVTFSATAEPDGADWTARDVSLAADGSTFTAVGPSGSWPVQVPLAGAFNVANALAAVAAAAEAGLDPAAAAVGLSSGGGVPGRLERVDAGQDFVAVVDYAHKPDAVEAALAALRPVTPGRLVVVLGAGGDRDTGKRPVMGEIAARLADVLVVTDDNPRTEDPAAIRAAVLAGAAGPAEVREVGDRRAAIAEAVALARSGDTVVVAGKGHETGQEVAGVVHPFDDRVVLREEIARAGGAA